MNNLEYCTWAMDAVQGYYDKLLIIETNNPYTSLRGKGGQFAWCLDELMEWTRMKEQFK